MTRVALPQPGLAYGIYPEQLSNDNPLDALSGSLKAIFRSNPSLPRHYGHFARAVIDRAIKLKGLESEAFEQAITQARYMLKKHQLTDKGLLDAIAITREVIRRQNGIETYPTQIMAARVMLDKALAEMQTGEGKTLAIAMAALSCGLAEIPVHVITANDYLVTRDANQLRPIAARLNLTVGAILNGMSAEDRRAQYARDIVYCTVREVTFDYLKDQSLGEPAPSDLHRRIQQVEAESTYQPLLRGLCLAIVDEADSIFLDESYTPLILSQDGKSTVESDTYREAFEISALLRKKRDFEYHPHSHKVWLTPIGRERLDQQCEHLAGLWRNPHFREEVIIQALLARHTYRRDRDYLVKDGEVHIIDATTGRIADGRKWSRGLHTLIEIKENCENTAQRHTLAQITYQRFFPRYLHLCGTSATLMDSRRELRKVYDLPTYAIPLQQTSLRQNFGTRVFFKREHKWRETVLATKKMQQLGRPVLIGTDSVGDSETLSRWFEKNNIPHRVLNARNNQEEAAIIANAGIAGRITIATNMAGRGTDIKLSGGARTAGGLHVICCQLNASKRIDRQLHGRCARQGDPGSVETILSLEDPLLQTVIPQTLRDWLRKRFDRAGQLPLGVGRLVATLAQYLEEKRYRSLRENLRKQDKQLKKALGVTGQANF